MTNEFFNQVYAHAFLIGSAATAKESIEIAVRSVQNSSVYSDEMRTFYLERLTSVRSLLLEIESAALLTVGRSY